MLSYIRCLLGLIAITLLTACSSPASPVADVPQPEAGKATLMGRMVSASTGEPIPNTGVRLAEIYDANGEDVYVLDIARSPGTFTDDGGYFIFANIPANSYVMFLTDDEMINAAITEAPDVAKAWKVEPDQILDLGSVSVEWP